MRTTIIVALLSISFMTRSLLAAFALVLGLAQQAQAQVSPVPAGTFGGPNVVPRDRASDEISARHPFAVAAAQALGLGVVDEGAAIGDRTLAFPLNSRPNSPGMSPFAISGFMDHDATGGVRDFACGNRTYDGHQGVDIFLTPFSWTRMDEANMEIVAAAPGTIVERQDGQFDRQCSWSNQNPPANYVIVRHDDGLYAYYWHMKNGSVTTAAVGTRVAAGDPLGIVGSSGFSTGPHLHFELRTQGGQVVDPFAGACNATTTAWKHQWHAELDTRLIEASTSFAAPVFSGACAASIDDDPKYANVFAPGGTVYGVVSIRDQGAADVATISFVRPDGSIAASGATGPGVTPFFESSTWWRAYALPGNAPTGTWMLRATMGGQTIEHGFFVGAAPAATQIYGAILPGGRSVQNATAATLLATILNAGSQTAHGCSINFETPLDADFSFQTTDPATNQLTGQPNRAVSIPAGTARTFLVAFSPHAGANAAAWTTRLRFRCTNAPAAQSFDSVNTALLSMSPQPVPDIIPIAATVSNDQVIRLASTSSTGIMAAAAVNIGLSANLTVRPRVSGGAAAIALVCRTVNSQCVAAPAASVAHGFAPNQTATFTVFVTANGAIPFQPATKRVLLDFVDAGGIIRGQTAAAVTTAP